MVNSTYGRSSIIDPHSRQTVRLATSLATITRDIRAFCSFTLPDSFCFRSRLNTASNPPPFGRRGCKQLVCESESVVRVDSCKPRSLKRSARTGSLRRRPVGIGGRSSAERRSFRFLPSANPVPGLNATSRVPAPSFLSRARFGFFYRIFGGKAIGYSCQACGYVHVDNVMKELGPSSDSLTAVSPFPATLPLVGAIVTDRSRWSGDFPILNTPDGGMWGLDGTFLGRISAPTERSRLRLHHLKNEEGVPGCRKCRRKYHSRDCTNHSGTPHLLGGVRLEVVESGAAVPSEVTSSKTGRMVLRLALRTAITKFKG